MRTTRPEQAWSFELSEAALRRDNPPAVSTLPLEGTNTIERSANRALRWSEQSQLAVDPIMELIMLSTALEAILGRKSDKLKARPLAIRRAILGLKMTGSFTHPARFYLVYDRVRSVVIHGGEPPQVDPDLVITVSWDVPAPLSTSSLDFARAEGLVKRDAPQRPSTAIRESRSWSSGSCPRTDRPSTSARRASCSSSPRRIACR